MTLSQAAEIIQSYGDALQSPPPGPAGPAKFASLLPCSHQKIKQAAMVRLADAYDQNRLQREFIDAVRCALMFLHHFIPDDKAVAVNSQTDAAARSEFMSEMTNYSVLDDIDDFVRKLTTLDRDEPLFWQRVYTLIGLEYNPDKLEASSVATKNTSAHPAGCLGLLALGSGLGIVGYLLS